MGFPAIWLLLAMAQAARLGGMNVVEPTQAGDARVLLTFDKPAFSLGEPVLLHFCLENTSGTPFSIDVGGDYRGGSRSSRFKVMVTNAAGSSYPIRIPAVSIWAASHLSLKSPLVRATANRFRS